MTATLSAPTSPSWTAEQWESWRSEVRSLAARSAEAAKQIRVLISDSVQKVQHGSRVVTESGSALSDIDTAVTRVMEAVDEIASASQQQASGIDQVNRAISQMDEMTQQNAALSEQATAASQSIVQQVARLDDLVARYRRDADSRVPAPDRALRTRRQASAQAAGGGPSGNCGIESVMSNQEAL